MLARSPRGWQESRSGRLVISHFPKQRHRQAAALPPVRPASLPPVPRSPTLSLSFSLYILSRCFVPLCVPSTGRSRSPLFSVSLRGSVLSSYLSRTTVSIPATLPSLPHPAPARRLRDSDSETRSGISLPSRRAPSAVASRRSRLLPSWRETPPPSPPPPPPPPRSCSPPLPVLSLSRVYLD